MPTTDSTAIPADATRIKIGQHYYLSAADAHAALARYPELRECEIAAETGPVPLHMSGNILVHWTAWSDGKLLYGDVPHLRETERPRRLAATENLVGRYIQRAGRRQEIGPLWLRWLDATGTTTERLAGGVDERAVGADRIATRILDLTRHTVHRADGTDDHVFVLQEQVHMPAQWEEPIRQIRKIGTMHGMTWVFTDEAEARAMLAARDDHRRPVVTAAEAAAELGTTPEALRQAIARRQREPGVPFVTASVGRTNWYAMQPLADWWRSRPGHGPGRGHTS